MICIRKSSTEELRLELAEERGHPVVNLRVWWRQGSTWHPSKDGFSLAVSFRRANTAGEVTLEIDHTMAAGVCGR